MNDFITLRFIIFVFIYLFIVNRHIILAFFEGLFHRRTGNYQAKDITDKNVLRFIQVKTGLKLTKILLFDTDKLWGMMAGFPPRPYMVVSTDAKKKLNKNEMEWLYLHEAGHFVLWHNLQMFLLQLAFIISGSVILTFTRTNIFLLDCGLVILLSTLFSIGYFQLARYFEYQANNFALNRMTYPESVVTIAAKAKKRWFGKDIVKNRFLHKLFNTWIYDIYRDLIKSSELEIGNRKLNRSIQ